MKVWIINPFDNLPVEGFRPQRFWLMARAFASAGHKTVLWSADFSHALKKPRQIGKEDLERAREDLAGAELRLVHEPPYGANISLKRLWSHRRWAANWRRAAEEETPPDVIIVSSPPLSIGAEARRYAEMNGAKLIVDVMDAWPETFERVVPKWILKPLASMAGKTYRAASAVTVVARRYMDLVKGTYGVKRPVRLFYHGIEFPPAGGAPRLRAPGEPLKVAYLGNMSASYDLATAIEAVKGMEGVTLTLAGRGPDEERLRELAKGADNIRFMGYLGGDGVADFLSGCDVGLVPMDPKSCVGIPYKLADYASASLKIASSLGGELDELLRRTHAGVAYRYGDRDDLRRALLLLKVMDCDSSPLKGLFDARSIYRRYVAFVEGLPR